MYDHGQMIERFARIERLESQRVTVITIGLIVISIDLLAFSPLFGGSDATDSLPGVLLGKKTSATYQHQLQTHYSTCQ